MAELITGVFNRIKASASAPDAPFLNDLVFPFSRNNTEVGKLQFALVAGTLATAFTLTGAGIEFFSDAGGTTSLGTSVNITAGGEKTYYYKATASTGKLILRNPQSLLSLGQSTSGDWNGTQQFIPDSVCTFTGFDIAGLAVCTAITRVMLGSVVSKGDTGYLSGLSNLVGIVLNSESVAKPILGGASFMQGKPLAFVNINGLDNLDVKYLPASVYAVESGAKTNSISCTGGGTLPAPTNLAYFGLNANTAMPTAQVDNLLISLSASLTLAESDRTLAIKGVRTSASNTAVSNLSSKRYTVVANA